MDNQIKSSKTGPVSGPDHDNTTVTQADRAHIIARTGWVSVLMNAAFAAIKFAIGSASHSLAITTDAMNNLSDAVSSVITVAGIKLAERKPTRKHPLGYGRIEYLSALVISVIIILAGYEFFKSSWQRILHPVFSTVTWMQIMLIILTILGKIYMWHIDIKNGRKYHSDALIASGRDALNDTFSTALTILAALAVILWHTDIDGWAGLAISIMIIWSGFQSLMDAAGSIIGRPASPETASQIRRIILTCPPIINTSNLIINSIGPENVRGTINVEVPDTVNAGEAFDAMDTAEREILSQTGIHLVLGLVAVNYQDPAVRDVWQKIKRAVLAIPGTKDVNGFRLKQEPKHVHFDVTVAFKSPGLNELTKKIDEAVREVCPDCKVDFDVYINDVGK